MAKVLFTAVVADMRNKLNGSVFSKNRYGSYIRTKVTPVNPQTDRQQAQRQGLGNLSSAWRGLSEGQRLGWMNAAPSFPITDIFGNPKILSGQALFVKLNLNLLQIGEPQINDAPSPVAIPTIGITDVEADLSSSTIDVNMTGGPVPADYSLIVYATPLVAPGISFVKNLYRVISYWSATTTIEPLNIYSAWNEAFGNLVEGQKIFVKCALVSTITGQMGVAVSSYAIVHA